MGLTETPSGGVGFLIVGSARSGTTLVQRLACEISGVGMPPETHFFSSFASDLLHRRAFPLAGSDLREELDRFSSLETSKGIEIDQTAIMDDLGNVARSPFELFEAIVRALARNSAVVLGEKSRASPMVAGYRGGRAPWVRFAVVVVRDPRAVVASNLSCRGPTTMMSPRSPIGSICRSQRRWGSTSRRRPPSCDTQDSPLLLRYEDVVSDPSASRRMLRVVSRTATAWPRSSPPRNGSSFRGSHGSRGRSMRSRATACWAWGSNLPAREADEVAAICRRGMKDRYPMDVRALCERLASGRRSGRRTHGNLRRFLDGYHAYHRYITSTIL